MDEEEDKKAGSIGFIITCAAVILPILYVLSIGPAIVMIQKNPSLIEVYNFIYTPVSWLHQNTPLQTPLENYIKWWLELL